MYDYLIIGSGLFGATFANQVTKAGKKCLVIDKRSVAGGNVACKNIEGINVHQHGPHIFHTNDETIWNFVNSFVEFKQFVYSPMARRGDKMYNLPFNMNTFYQMWGTLNPNEAKVMVERDEIFHFDNPANLEQQALTLVGYDIYNTLIKDYTEKQWGRPCNELPAYIIKRLPVRYTFDNNYFNDKYQGIPVGGYNPLISGLLSGIEVKLSTDYFANPEHFNSLALTIVYTGPLDQYFNYQFGELEYRSLRFEHETLPTANFQGCSVVNYVGQEVPYTRVIEHKHFEAADTHSTVISREYPAAWQRGDEPYYPINDESNQKRYKQYSNLAKQEENLIVGGRLGRYQYMDMHQVIGAGLKAAAEAIK